MILKRTIIIIMIEFYVKGERMDIFLVAARIFIAAFLGALIGTEREKKTRQPVSEHILL